MCRPVAILRPPGSRVARRSSGRPELGGDPVRIYFEGGVYGQVNMRTLGDRARHAHGRLAEDYPTTATRTVPRQALVAVGIFESRSTRILLTGPHSEAVVASWLGMISLDSDELGSTAANNRERRPGT